MRREYILIQPDIRRFIGQLPMAIMLEKRNLFVNVDGVGGSFHVIVYITVMFLFLLKTMWHRFLFESGIDF